MEKLDFVSDDFQKFVDNLPDVKLGILLFQAFTILKEKECSDNARILNAIEKWNHFHSQDIGYSNDLYEFANEADLLYQNMTQRVYYVMMPMFFFEKCAY